MEKCLSISKKKKKKKLGFVSQNIKKISHQCLHFFKKKKVVTYDIRF